MISTFYWIKETFDKLSCYGKRYYYLTLSSWPQAELAADTLREITSSERKTIKDSSYSVSAILSTSCLSYTSRSDNLQELLDENNKYTVYKFNIRYQVLSSALLICYSTYFLAMVLQGNNNFLDSPYSLVALQLNLSWQLNYNFWGELIKYWNKI